ncbi:MULTISPECIES: hypothetical protein [unclassified Pseudoalteromonas]|uniref:hypothetical protein n=1 Tax=unclassified Pseudoalteromonas TaxID=194690 RepID=UPI00386E3BA1
MGNLFLQEKENWLAWSIWGILGAFLTLYVGMSTNAALFIACSAIGVLAVLTWWMQQSKRFGFARAFKICCYVLLLSALPAVMLVVVPSGELNHFDLIFQSITLFTLSLLICLICSWIARKPKQYY